MFEKLTCELPKMCFANCSRVGPGEATWEMVEQINKGLSVDQSTNT